MTIVQFSDAAEIFTQKQRLSSDVILCTIQDREGNVCIGTGAGLDALIEVLTGIESHPGGSAHTAL